jgi:Flp pilus assembly pilin Flp
MIINYLIYTKRLSGRYSRSVETGQGLIEYALIILLIVIGVIIILGLVGGGVRDLYQKIINGLS